MKPGGRLTQHARYWYHGGTSRDEDTKSKAQRHCRELGERRKDEPEANKPSEEHRYKMLEATSGLAAGDYGASKAG